MAEKANIIVDYKEEWFEKNWFWVSIWCHMHMGKGMTLEREFARFQIQEDADKFTKLIAP